MLYGTVTIGAAEEAAGPEQEVHGPQQQLDTRPEQLQQTTQRLGLAFLNHVGYASSRQHLTVAVRLAMVCSGDMSFQQYLVRSMSC